ncbi:MAG: FtsX-like permease family protein [Nocardioidaceae bacterium]
MRFNRLAQALATELRGLWSRSLLTVGAVLLVTISVAAAVVAPIYQTASANSYLVTQLRDTESYLTGINLAYQPAPGQTVDTQTAKQAAARIGAAAASAEFARPQVTLVTPRPLNKNALTGPIGLLRRTGACQHIVKQACAKVAGETEFGIAELLSKHNACQHLVVVGRCPNHPGEAIVLKSDLRYTGAKPGDGIALHGLRSPLKIVGTYTVPPGQEHYWFDLTRLASVPPQPANPSGFTPYLPAPFVVASSTFAELPAGGWSVLVDRALIVGSNISITDVRQAITDVRRLGPTTSRLAAGANVQIPAGNELGAIAHEFEQRASTSESTVTPAVASLILVALVLLLRLLAAAADQRETELALASLRGASRRQMWALGLIEPALIVLIAVPIGFALGATAGRAFAALWLVPGIAATVSTASWKAALIVIVATLLVSVFVVQRIVSEPLSSQIAGVHRPARSSRWAVMLRLALIAAAVAVVGATVFAGKKSSPDATDLALPILLAIAAGLMMNSGASVAARWWSRRSMDRRGIAGFVASRAVSRRREGTLVILPLTAALAVSVFSWGVYSAAAGWRGSDAATKVGASRAYTTHLDLASAVALTHQADPQGKWLMAAATDFGGLYAQTLIVDAPRYGRVGLWPGTWSSGMAPGEVSAVLSPRRPPVTLTGSTISLTIDNRVKSSFSGLTVELDVVHNATGASDAFFIGPFQPGRSTQTTKVMGCGDGCQINRMAIGGPAGLPASMAGTARVTGFAVDGRPVAGAMQPWVPQAVLASATTTAAHPRIYHQSLLVGIDTHRQQTLAVISPGSVPADIPVLMGRTAALRVEAVRGNVLTLGQPYVTGSNTTLTVDRVATTESMPFLGPKGMMVDYTAFIRNNETNPQQTFVYILARGNTPAAVLAGLGEHGISQYTSLAAERHLLDQDPYALALNLYLVVTALVILLALIGLGVNLAVQLPERRLDAASLRVVGVRRRSLVRAAVTEYGVVMGVAAVAGILAGSLAQYLVVGTVTLGYADDAATPRLLATLNVVQIVILLAAVTAGLVAAAGLVAGLTVRGARTSTLRETAR